jgi:hypothetical protein
MIYANAGVWPGDGVKHSYGVTHVTFPLRWAESRGCGPAEPVVGRVVLHAGNRERVECPYKVDTPCFNQIYPTRI